jgi:hypothetical protein
MYTSDRKPIMQPAVQQAHRRCCISWARGRACLTCCCHRSAKACKPAHCSEVRNSLGVDVEHALLAELMCQIFHQHMLFTMSEPGPLVGGQYVPHVTPPPPTHTHSPHGGCAHTPPMARQGRDSGMPWCRRGYVTKVCYKRCNSQLHTCSGVCRYSVIGVGVM